MRILGSSSRYQEGSASKFLVTFLKLHNYLYYRTAISHLQSEHRSSKGHHDDDDRPKTSLTPDT